MFANFIAAVFAWDKVHHSFLQVWGGSCACQIRGRNRAATRAKGLPITYEKPPSHPSGGGGHQAASPALSAAVGQGGCIGTIIALLGFVSSDLAVCSSPCPPGARL